MEKIRPLEIFLVEVVFYFVLWLLDDYLATLLSVALGAIFLSILLISLIVEWIERSKVPIWYYKFMIASILAPLLTAIVYLFFAGGVSWMQ